jgi:hypothetical protein
MAKKLYPFVNKYSGEVKILTKSSGKKLSEDWARAKMAVNDKGEDVFRFKIATSFVDKNGKTQTGTAIVDISEVEAAEVAEDGNGSAA